MDDQENDCLKKPMLPYERHGDLYKGGKSSYWYLDHRDSKGQRHRISTGEIDLTKAVKIKKTLLEKLHLVENKESYRHMIHDHFQRWVDIKSKSWAKGTTVDVIGKTKLFLEFAESKSLDSVNEVFWEEFIGWLHERVPGRRISKIQDYVSSFLKSMFHEGLIKRIPVLRDPDSASEVGRPLQDWEIEKLLVEITSDILRLQVFMQLKMGMRSGEALGLNKARIDMKSDVIRLKSEDTKTRTGRVIPIHPEVRDLLGLQIQASTSEWLFPSPTDETKPIRSDGNMTAWYNLLEKAGIQCRRHDLRHTCATHFARDGINPIMAARILGMSLEVYDRIYCKPSEADLKGVFRK